MFDHSHCSGIWMVCTGWNPEPLPDREGKCVTAAVCHSFALSLKPGNVNTRCGTLQLQWDRARPQLAGEIPATVDQVVDEFIKLDSLQQPCNFRWPLIWGATAQLRLTPPAQSLQHVA